MYLARHGARRFYVIVSLVVLTVCTLAGCGSSASQSKSKASPSTSRHLTNVTEAVFLSESWMPDFIAKAQGFFQQHGLNVTFIEPSDGVTATRLQIAGQIQIFPTDSGAAFAAIAKGFPLKLAGLMAPVGRFDFLARPGLSLPPSSASLGTKVRALEGKIIGVTGIGAATYNFPVRLFNQFGVSPSSVHFVAVGSNPTTVAGQLQAGRIDAYVTFGTAPLEELLKLVPGSTDYINFEQADPSVFNDIPSLSLQVDSSWAASHPQAITDYLAAVAEALTWAKTHQTQAADDLNTALFNGKFPSIAMATVTYALQHIYSQVQPGFKFPKSAFNIEKEFVVQVGLVTPAQAGTLSYSKDVLPIAQG